MTRKQQQGFSAKASGLFIYKPRKENVRPIIPRDSYGSIYSQDINGVIRRVGLKAAKVSNLWG